MTRLRELTLEITQDCLNSCIHCSSLGGHSSNGHLPFSQLAQLLHEASDLGLQHLSFSGGEPFLHSEFSRLLRLSKALAFPHVAVYTSGVVRDARRIAVSFGQADSFSDLLDSSAVLIFNIQSCEPEIHDAIVGKAGRFEIARRSLVEAVRRGFPVECHIVPNRTNLDSLVSTARELIELGVEKVSFLRLVPQGNAASNEHLLGLFEEDSKRLYAAFDELRKDHNSAKKYRFGIPFSGVVGGPGACGAGLSKLIMRWDGVFFPCEAFKESGHSEYILGHLGVDSLAAVLKRGQESLDLSLLKNFTQGQEVCPAQCLYH